MTNNRTQNLRARRILLSYANGKTAQIERLGLSPLAGL